MIVLQLQKLKINTKFVICSFVCVYVCVCVCTQTLSHVQLFATPWTVACQSPLYLGFLRQEHWSGLSFPSPGDLPDPGIESIFLTSSALAGRFFTAAPPGKLPDAHLVLYKPGKTASGYYCIHSSAYLWVIGKYHPILQGHLWPVTAPKTI